MMSEAWAGVPIAGVLARTTSMNDSQSSAAAFVVIVFHISEERLSLLSRDRKVRVGLRFKIARQSDH